MGRRLVRVYLQGLRMKDTGENLFHVLIVPRSHFSLAFQAGFGCLMAAEEIDGDFSEQ